MQSAPRIDRRLVGSLEKLDDRAHSIAETSRRIGDLAESLGLPRPSYERVRQLVHLHRSSPDDRIRDALVDLAFNTRAADRVIVDLLTADRTHWT